MFYNSILLWSVRARGLMNSAQGVEKTSELLREVLCGIVTSKDLNGNTKLSFELSTKVLEYNK